eukprot:scaffold1954_cov268-Pinguiococcus_pyrenoidosus.AAC.317
MTTKKIRELKVEDALLYLDMVREPPPRLLAATTAARKRSERSGAFELQAQDSDRALARR